MKKCSKCYQNAFDSDKFCMSCGNSFNETKSIASNKKNNELSKIVLSIAVLCLIVVSCIFISTFEFNSSNNKIPEINKETEEAVEWVDDRTIENDYSTAVEADSVALSYSEYYSGNNCAICGNPCKSEKEIRSNGDAVSKYEPYYLCGENIDCVYERERQNKVLQQSEEATYSSNEYNFDSDGDVLRYLLGKTFRQRGGSGYITFYSDGANLSGLKDYQWLSYETLGSFKGLVKLSSLDPNNPDGVLKLWVSCKDNAITDGSVVFLYN